MPRYEIVYAIKNNLITELGISTNSPNHTWTDGPYQEFSTILWPLHILLAD